MHTNTHIHLVGVSRFVSLFRRVEIFGQQELPFRRHYFDRRTRATFQRPHRQNWKTVEFDLFGDLGAGQHVSQLKAISTISERVAAAGFVEPQSCVVLFL